MNRLVSVLASPPSLLMEGLRPDKTLSDDSSSIVTRSEAERGWGGVRGGADCRPVEQCSRPTDGPGRRDWTGGGGELRGTGTVSSAPLQSDPPASPSGVKTS